MSVARCAALIYREAILSISIVKRRFPRDLALTLDSKNARGNGSISVNGDGAETR
jgi:hypothetical protein